MRRRALFLVWVGLASAAFGADRHPVARVEAVGMTVSDMDRAVDFYSKVLTFEKASDREVLGEDFESLQGVFGARMRIVRMRLGGEQIELTEYMAPRGRPTEGAAGLLAESRSGIGRSSNVRGTGKPN